MNIYQDTASDPMKLLYNFAHNLGSIYDVTEEGIHRSIDFEKNWNDTYYWSRMGHATGTVFQDLFEEPENYSTYEEYRANNFTTQYEHEREPHI